MKSFKTESKRILDLMINSIYTHKEIFLRELLSNCSDAIDKLYYKGLTEGLSGLTRNDFYIKINVDKDNKIIEIVDNGIGMTETELENNLGTIAKSGSLDFKSQDKEKKQSEEINIIGQFGVGFYSAFMVADKVEVISKAYGSDQAFTWVSGGAEGYEIKPSEREFNGTTIRLYLKDDSEDQKYSDFLEEYELKSLVKKYSDYIRYPIKMEVTKYKEQSEEDRKEGKALESYKEEETVNSMIPLWKKKKSEITKEEYNNFYKDMFYDYEEPLKAVLTSAEGVVDYKALLFVPAKAPYNYYTKEYKKGLRLYTNGVLITDNCEELLPDYFSFVKGLVDSELSLNISRETIQHNRQLKVIASNLEKKIKKELEDMLANDRENYQKFFKEFGLQLKYGLYSSWGANKDVLKDLIMFKSVKQDKMITLKEYVENFASEQKYIYYATGKTVDSVKTLPQTEKLIDYGYDVLLFSDDVDEFAIKMLANYDEKEFKNVTSEDLGLQNEDEAKFEDDKPMLDFIKESLNGKVTKVKASTMLKSHAVCLSQEGELSLEMEKVLNSMPNADLNGNSAKAQKVLEINAEHQIYKKAKTLFETDKDKLKDLAEVMFAQSLLISGLKVENQGEIVEKLFNLLAD